MITPTDGRADTLTVDFDMMRAVAAATDGRNEELRTLLAGFIARMQAVPPTVWSGPAAARFQEVVDRWNGESQRLHRALADIAATVRGSERTLREAAAEHARHIAATADWIGR